MRTPIETSKAPAPIGAYSQAIQVDRTVYLSGQLALDADTMTMIESDFRGRVKKIFENLQAVCTACGGSLNHIVKLTIFLTDLSQFPILNEVMEEFFHAPFPARSTIGVASLPKNTDVEIDAVMVLD